MWARCVELAADVVGNPLGAVVDRRGAVPLPALTSVDSSAFNRVVALGTATPATRRDIRRIIDFYLELGQHGFRVELSPAAAPGDLADQLVELGLHPVAETVTKVWRCFDDSDRVELAVDTDAIDVRRLTSSDAEHVSDLNVRAWGAWHSSVSLSPWFGATVGAEGFAHYGAFVDDRLVCVGAMAIDGDLAWIGFDATHPRHQARQLRRALTRRRITEALDAGCHVVHTEAATDRLTCACTVARHPLPPTALRASPGS